VQDVGTAILGTQPIVGGAAVEDRGVSGILQRGDA
jgi:hypothetical protein